MESDFKGFASVIISFYPGTSCVQYNFICHSIVRAYYLYYAVAEV
jgi:hypothetical protein